MGGMPCQMIRGKRNSVEIRFSSATAPVLVSAFVFLEEPNAASQQIFDFRFPIDDYET